jgi:hypothetical protein
VTIATLAELLVAPRFPGKKPSARIPVVAQAARFHAVDNLSVTE